MEKVTLKATRREVTGKQVRAVRREGKLPAVIYGRHIDKPIPVVLNRHESSLILARVGSSSLVNVDVDGTVYPVLVRERQRDILYGTLLHIDFMAVSMTEKLRAEVRIDLVGEAPAIARFGGTLVTGVDSLEIECLPGDLPESLKLDITGLVNISDALYVKDLTIPAGVEIFVELDEMVVMVSAPMAEEVEEAAAVTSAEEPEVIEKGKKEEEE